MPDGENQLFDLILRTNIVPETAGFGDIFRIKHVSDPMDYYS